MVDVCPFGSASISADVHNSVRVDVPSHISFSLLLPGTYRSSSATRVIFSVLRIAEDMASPSRHHGRSDRLIEDVEQAAQDLRAAVRGS
jgi:hypothetical protein